ncbi:hypothetical protein H9P43_007589 [Blastocladiella emersonii ATCC 22665]|nr:hypothetical protein H9P43_007589 [Blastocladiella emersonii ATCC 22665]
MTVFPASSRTASTANAASIRTALTAATGLVKPARPTAKNAGTTASAVADTKSGDDPAATSSEPADSEAKDDGKVTRADRASTPESPELPDDVIAALKRDLAKLKLDHAAELAKLQLDHNAEREAAATELTLAKRELLETKDELFALQRAHDSTVVELEKAKNEAAMGAWRIEDLELDLKLATDALNQANQQLLQLTSAQSVPAVVDPNEEVAVHLVVREALVAANMFTEAGYLAAQADARGFIHAAHGPNSPYRKVSGQFVARRRSTDKFDKPFAGVSVDGAGGLTLGQVLAKADTLAPHGPVQVPIPGGRDKIESHKKKIVVRYGQRVFVIDAGVRDFLTGFVVPFELARLFWRLQYLAYLAAQGGDGPWSEVLKAYIRSAVLRVVLTQPLFQSLSSREFHHHVGTDQARNQRKASRAKAGLVPGDAAHVCVASDHRAVARVATEYMEAKVEESCSHGVCSTKFTNEGRRKAYWADLARALRGHVVLIGRKFSGFGMISAADKGPVVEMVKELRLRGVTVYAVDEN